MNNKYLEEFIILMDLSEDWNTALREYFKDYKFRSLRDVFIAWEYFHKKYIQPKINNTVSTSLKTLILD